jgi:hypothetical protein
MSDNPPIPVEPAAERVDAAVAAAIAELTYELDDAGRAAVREKVIGHLKLGDALRAFPLTNADEPDFVFSVYRAEG